ncbi:MAG TPA: aromatic amino acid lyase, partial [Gaiellales bacterium]|nr:aromatic amino acid lyase [Gaiellales bacterium]
MAATLQLTGHDLAIADVERAAFDAGLQVELSPAALDQIDAARALIDRVVAERIPTYGVNTGFGRFVDVHIEREQVADLQLNLLRSHACGLGDPFPGEVVRAALLLRANTLAKGASGVRRVVVERL